VDARDIGAASDRVDTQISEHVRLRIRRLAKLAHDVGSYGSVPAHGRENTSRRCTLPDRAACGGDAGACTQRLHATHDTILFTGSHCLAAAYASEPYACGVRRAATADTVAAPTCACTGSASVRRVPPNDAVRALPLRADAPGTPASQRPHHHGGTLLPRGCDPQSTPRTAHVCSLPCPLPGVVGRGICVN
jgi:hypothetical protein